MAKYGDCLFCLTHSQVRTHINGTLYTLLGAPQLRCRPSEAAEARRVARGEVKAIRGEAQRQGAEALPLTTLAMGQNPNGTPGEHPIQSNH